MSAVIGRRAEAPPDEPEVPVIPEWLVDELHGNVAFVRDAIEAEARLQRRSSTRARSSVEFSQTYRAIQDAVDATSKPNGTARTTTPRRSAARGRRRRQMSHDVQRTMYDDRSGVEL
jgi:hypothetical protein